MSTRKFLAAARTQVRRKTTRTRFVRRIVLAAAVLWAFAAAPAFAQQWNFVGSRFQAMGGAGVGTVEDSTAFYWNPAALGFKKKGEWDVQLPITVNASIENELIEQVSDLAFRSDEINTAFDLLKAGDPNLLTSASLGDAVGWLADLDALGTVPQSVHSEIGVGLLGSVGNFGFGGLSNTSLYVFPDIDLSTIGFDTTNLTTFLGSVPAQAGQAQLKADVAALGTYWNAGNAAQFVDAFIINANVDLNDPETRDVVLLLAEGVNATGTFADNDSGVLTAGLSIQEIGVSYGFAIPSPWFKRWLDRKVSVGITGKYMMGIAFVRTASYADGISGSGLGDIETFFSDNVISHRFGLDVGLDYRPLPFARIGIVARNINVPKFDAGSFGDIKVKPQVRMGMALEPIERLILALDVDLTENGNPEIESSPARDLFRSRLISLGTEYTVPLGKPCALALRFGTYKNTIDSIDEGWALTGGLGLKLWGFWLDLSAGGGLERERVRTDLNEYVNVPDRMNVGLGFKWEKSL